MCYASQKITDRGYARHYSLLQKECFHLPPLAEQSRIVNCIDSLYAKGMTTRQISETIEDIYGFETSEGLGVSQSLCKPSN